jgi:hypothetical protein
LLGLGLTGAKPPGVIVAAGMGRRRRRKKVWERCRKK